MELGFKSTGLKAPITGVRVDYKTELGKGSKNYKIVLALNWAPAFNVEGFKTHVELERFRDVMLNRVDFTTVIHAVWLIDENGCNIRRDYNRNDKDVKDDEYWRDYKKAEYDLWV